MRTISLRSAQVGYDLYMKMLKKAIKKLSGIDLVEVSERASDVCIKPKLN